VDGYEQVPDPGDEWSPTKRQVRRQREFEAIRAHAVRMAAEAPPLSEEALHTIATFMLNRPPESDLVEWRLRLFCGHVVTRRSHHTNTTVHMAFKGSVACPECGLDRATIVSAEALRRLAPDCPREQERGRDDAAIRRAIARHEREIEKLRAQLGER
jgi:hypothetical protein